jgi:hypothetical protein
VRKILLGWVVLSALVLSPLAVTMAQAPFSPGGAQVGPGSSFGNAIEAFLFPQPSTFANLPACTASTVGTKTWVTNGASIVINNGAAGGGTNFTAVYCAQSAPGVYAWAIDPANVGSYVLQSMPAGYQSPVTTAVTVTALTGCVTGGSPAVVGNQSAMLVTAGTTASATCTITWPTTRLSAPNCAISAHTAAAGAAFTTVENTTTLTWTFTSTASTVWDVLCVGT